MRLDWKDRDRSSDSFAVGLCEFLDIAISNLQSCCEALSFFLLGQISLVTAVKQKKFANSTCPQRSLPIVRIVKKICRESEACSAKWTTFSEMTELDAEVELLIWHESVLNLVQDRFEMLGLVQMRLTFLLQRSDLSI